MSIGAPITRAGIDRARWLSWSFFPAYGLNLIGLTLDVVWLCLPMLSFIALFAALHVAYNWRNPRFWLYAASLVGAACLLAAIWKP